ncbi:uncharacterized protein FIBRA_07900 [Fibroporia radiculosa]|uniref:PHD-type domain-containing protein n=1 Tax=Fibroporia radiculosa TaxID=599839 RepID=J4GVT9_9APHY|nr:uncharacterized protein FIBRA_07900 [Fibroporia radiculosa]CCM05670.1 predicted protein [Fibroporia radiculosa]
MRNDATEEAALGLLGLGITSAFDSVSTVPLKRKQSSSSSTHLPEERNSTASSDSINCICGFTYDDGFSIGCDSCSRWCHAACFGIVESEVPEEWQCWVCSPRHTDRERAVRVQKARQKAALQHEAERQRRRVSPGVDRKGRRASAAAIEGSGSHKRKRRLSINVQPSVEDEVVDIDEPWTHSYVHIDKDIVPHDETRDKLRRVATQWRGVMAIDSDASSSASPSTTPAVLGTDTLLSASQIQLQPLNKAAMQPAFSASFDPSVLPPSYAVHAARAIPSAGYITPYTSTITPSTSYLSDPLNAYAHLSIPKPFVHLIGPPLDVALDARLAGNTGRFVRNGCRPNSVLRPVLCHRKKSAAAKSLHDGGVDNDDTLTFGIFALRDLKAHEEVVLGWEWDDGSVVHHLPALIDSPHMFPYVPYVSAFLLSVCSVLIVCTRSHSPHQLRHFRHQLMSMLHALSSTFTTCACGSKTKDCALTRMAEFVDSGTPPTPSPSPPSTHTWEPFGESHRKNAECAEERDRASEGLARRKTDLGPLVGVERGFRVKERVPSSGGMTGVELIPSARHAHLPTEPEPQASGSFAAIVSERPRSTSMRRVVSTSALKGKPPVRSQPTQTSDRKGKAKVTDEDLPSIDISASRSAMDVDDPEERLPPKLRKRWIHKSYETLRDNYRRETTPPSAVVFSDERPSDRIDTDQGKDGMDIDRSTFDPKEMPPPPLPSSRSNPASAPLSLHLPGNGASDASMSPSIPFANLTLLSPALSNPSTYFARRRSVSPSVPRNPSPVSLVTQPNAHKEMRDSEPSSELPAVESRRISPTPVVHDVQEPAPGPLSISATPDSSGLISENHADQLIDGIAFTHVHASSVGSLTMRDDKPSQQHEVPILDQSLKTPNNAPSTERLPESDQTPFLPLPPPPPPPSKVKMSLKDFAMRKKKKKEEELMKAQTSPPAISLSLDGVSLSPEITNEPLHPNLHSMPDYVPAIESIPPSDQPGSARAAPDRSPTVEERRLELDGNLSASDSLQAKIEMVEVQVLPSDIPQVSESIKSIEANEPAFSSSKRMEPFTRRSGTPEPQLRATGLSDPARRRSSSFRHSRSPSHDRTSTSSSQEPRQQASQEDGEILSPPLQPSPPARHLSSRWCAPPPTHPRSFSDRPSRLPSNYPPFALRPPPPHTSLRDRSLPDRGLPIGPRALRAASSQYVPPPPPRLILRPAIARGPSVDRDRPAPDWERWRSSREPGPGRGWR